MCVHFERVNGTTEEFHQLNLQPWAVFFFLLTANMRLGLLWQPSLIDIFISQAFVLGRWGRHVSSGMCENEGITLPPASAPHWGDGRTGVFSRQYTERPQSEKPTLRVKTAWRGCWGSGWPCREASTEPQVGDSWGLTASDWSAQSSSIGEVKKNGVCR